MAGGELLHTTCLSADTLVAMADIEPVGGVKPPRVRLVSDLEEGMRLVGTGDPVTITHISPVETTDVMYEVQHTDGTAYRVTCDHLVTLRWCAGPRTDRQQSNTPDASPLISLRWWIWQDGRVREGCLKAHRWTETDTWDDVCGKLWAEFNTEAALPGSDASLALFTGDLIDVPVSALDSQNDPALWNMLFADGEIRATAAEVELPILDCERAATVVRADVEAAVAVLPAGVVAGNLAAAQMEVTQHACAAIIALSQHAVVAQPGVSIQLLGPGMHRSVTPGDRVNLVVQLHSPLSGVSNGTRQASAITNLEGIFADIGVPLGESSGVVITETTLMAGETSFIDSRQQVYDAVCDAQMMFILNVLGASTIVACSAHASFRWRGAGHLPGISNLVNHASENGEVTVTTFDSTRTAEIPGRKVTVYHTVHPGLASNKEAIEQTILRALGLPSSTVVHRPLRRIAHINKITQTNQKFRRFTVDGDSRFAMADGTVTHVSFTENTEQALKADDWQRTHLCVHFV